MISPNFQLSPVYNFKVFDDKSNLIYTGVLNSKSWSKTIETNEIWEYIPDNGRVIGKDFYPFVLDLKNIKNEDGTIEFYLIDEVVKQKPENKREPKIKNDSVLLELEKVIMKRKAEMPENSYTTHLFEKGEEKILKKLGEEAIELILASKTTDDEIVYETADLLYHILVYLTYKNIPFENVLSELKKRMEK
jgi:phosphoribosyl-ATP pyrophosphohydrolase